MHAVWFVPAALVAYTFYIGQHTCLVQPQIMAAAALLIAGVAAAALSAVFTWTPIPCAQQITNTLRMFHHSLIAGITSPYAFQALYIQDGAVSWWGQVVVVYVFWSYACLSALDAWLYAPCTTRTNATHATHHAITLALVLGSVVINYTHTGLTIVYLYSLTSIPLSLRQVITYTNLRTWKPACDALLVLLWFGLRMPCTLFWSWQLFVTYVIDASMLAIVFFVALSALNALNVLWSCTILYKLWGYNHKKAV
jgi:hypothetical protein